MRRKRQHFIFDARWRRVTTTITAEIFVVAHFENAQIFSAKLFIHLFFFLRIALFCVRNSASRSSNRANAVFAMQIGQMRTARCTPRACRWSSATRRIVFNLIVCATNGERRKNTSRSLPTKTAFACARASRVKCFALLYAQLFASIGD